MEYLIITNNEKTRVLSEQEKVSSLIYIDGPVLAVLRKCEDIFLEGKYALSADLMAGRRIRPFPCLTVILQPAEEGPRESDWIRIADYTVLDQERKPLYQDLSSRALSDYQTLDLSLTKAGLGI